MTHARVDGRGPTALVLFERRIGDLTRVIYHRAGSAASLMSPEDVLPALDPPPRLLHVTGITPAARPGHPPRRFGWPSRGDGGGRAGLPRRQLPMPALGPRPGGCRRCARWFLRCRCSSRPTTSWISSHRPRPRPNATACRPCSTRGWPRWSSNAARTARPATPRKESVHAPARPVRVSTWSGRRRVRRRLPVRPARRPGPGRPPRPGRHHGRLRRRLTRRLGRAARPDRARAARHPPRIHPPLNEAPALRPRGSGGDLIACGGSSTSAPAAASTASAPTSAKATTATSTGATTTATPSKPLRPGPPVASSGDVSRAKASNRPRSLIGAPSTMRNRFVT